MSEKFLEFLEFYDIGYNSIFRIYENEEYMKITFVDGEIFIIPRFDKYIVFMNEEGYVFIDFGNNGKVFDINNREWFDKPTNWNVYRIVLERSCDIRLKREIDDELIELPYRFNKRIH